MSKWMIVVTVNKVNSNWSFHQFLKGCYQFVDSFILTLSYVSCHAVVYVIGKQLAVEGIDSGIDGCGLDQDVITVGIVFQHSYDSPNLAFNTLQTIDEFLAFFVCAGGVFRTTAAGTDFFISRDVRFLSGGCISIFHIKTPFGLVR